MKKVCDYCSSQYDDTLEKCPNCGAPNDNVRKASGVPTTIEQLKQWYVDHHLPPEETTRFFIGKDIKEPKAFGIYKDDSGDFVVYKNKADGSRAVRYKGGSRMKLQDKKEISLQEAAIQTVIETEVAVLVRKVFLTIQDLAFWALLDFAGFIMCFQVFRLLLLY